MKIGPKEAQRKALRERADSKGGGRSLPLADPGLISRSEPEPKGLGIPAKFDRAAYQREYMRKWRAKRKSKV